jgi:hypothetical protein
MKQLPGEIRDRLARKPSGQSLLNKADVTEAAEAREADENGGQGGSPTYFGKPSDEKAEGPQSEENGQEEGKGTQLDLEV